VSHSSQVSSSFQATFTNQPESFGFPRFIPCRFSFLHDRSGAQPFTNGHLLSTTPPGQSRVIPHRGFFGCLAPQPSPSATIFYYAAALPQIDATLPQRSAGCSCSIRVSLSQTLWNRLRHLCRFLRSRDNAPLIPFCPLWVSVTLAWSLVASGRHRVHHQEPLRCARSTIRFYVVRDSNDGGHTRHGHLAAVQGDRSRSVQAVAGSRPGQQLNKTEDRCAYLGLMPVNRLLVGKPSRLLATGANRPMNSVAPLDEYIGLMH